MKSYNHWKNEFIRAEFKLRDLSEELVRQARAMAQYDKPRLRRKPDRIHMMEWRRDLRSWRDRHKQEANLVLAVAKAQVRLSYILERIHATQPTRHQLIHEDPFT